MTERQSGIVAGLRIALAEIVMLRVEYEQSIEPRAAANRDRRARVSACRVAYNRVNRRLADEAQL